MSKKFESKFAIIFNDGTICLFNKTQFNFSSLDTEEILKDVELVLEDDHIIHITGVAATGHYTSGRLFVDEIADDLKTKLLPIETRKTLFKNREYILGFYYTWNDYRTELYLKFDPYSIKIIP